MIVMGVDPVTSMGAEWFQPNTYSVWVYDRGDNEPPIFFVAYEWERGPLRGVRVESVWLNQEEDPSRHWDSYPEREKITGDPESVTFARLVEEGKAHRIGSLPSIGWFAEPPSWLTE
jgi:hypothetical protein